MKAIAHKSQSKKGKPSLEQLRSFWSALPDSASFKHFFDGPLYEVDQAEDEIRKIEARLTEWKQMRDDAIERLAKRVENAAAAEWSAEQIEQAKQDANQ